jgi:methyl-accepting chemotaxis protein
MVSMKFSVSTKLAIASGISLLLVVGMLANEQISNRATEAAYGEALREQQVVKLTAAGTAAIRNGLLALGNLRTARSRDQVEGALSGLQTATKDGHERMDAARRLSVDAANQARMDEAASLFDQFAAAAAPFAAARIEVIEAEALQNSLGVRWGGAWENLESTLVLSKSGNRSEIDSSLREGARQFMDARNAYWRFMSTEEPQALQHMKQLLLSGMGALRSITDPELEHDVKALSRILEQSGTTMEKGAKAVKTASDIWKNKMEPLSGQIDATVQQISAAGEDAAQASVVSAGASMRRSEQIGYAVGAVAVVILIGTALFGSFSIGRPLTRVGAVLLELAHGNKAVEIPYVTRGDEVGDAARAASTFRDNLVEMERLQTEQREAEARIAEEKRAADERTAADKHAAEQKAAAERKAMMERLAAEFEAAVGNIVETVSNASHELEAAASSLSKTAETTEQLSGTVASASEDASANVKSVAAASEEMTSSVQEIGRQVNESSKIAGEAVSQAEKTDARIGQLSEAASRIGDVVKLITAIAEQTNLLALNATIEAARAGEAGKGFAVVAQEVKALASQTAKATDEIAGQITGMQAETRESVLAIKEISGTVRRISDIATTIAAAVEEQGAATGEISRNALLAAQGTAQVAVNITDVNRGASETGTASARVLASAQSLAGESGRLKREVEKFLNTVRAA